MSNLSIIVLMLLSVNAMAEDININIDQGPKIDPSTQMIMDNANAAMDFSRITKASNDGLKQGQEIRIRELQIQLLEQQLKKGNGQ